MTTKKYFTEEERKAASTAAAKKHRALRKAKREADPNYKPRKSLKHLTPEQYAKYKSQFALDWYYKNTEKALTRMKGYNKTHRKTYESRICPDTQTTYNKKYYEANKEKAAIRQHRYYLKRKEKTQNEYTAEQLIEVLKTVCTTDANGNKVWRLNDKLHRVDGPAVEFADGSKSWYLNGQLHRVDGPAIEYATGDKSWCLNGQKLTEEEFNEKRKNAK